MHRGGYCLGFTKVQIRFVFDDNFVSLLYMKCNVGGSHYNHLVDKTTATVLMKK